MGSKYYHVQGVRMDKHIIKKEDIVYECLKILDGIATTHADSGTLRKMALDGIKEILKLGELDEEMAS
tara:strand:- start:2858 stop:3061 length:204 start_codon:yes stop_codon:yes gene_type:complete